LSDAPITATALGLKITFNASHFFSIAIFSF
jgi:hypothetical protein